MAKMIPPYIHRDVRSNAEKKVYTLIENDSYMNQWVCLHSLGLAYHVAKSEGEIDFLLVGPPGIFCLEVKGGRVERKDGIWHFTDRYGIEHKKTEGPFKQVAGAQFSLMKHLKARFESLVCKTLFGYGVVIPDSEFKRDTVEWDNRIVYDLSDRLKPFSAYIKRLVAYWQEKHPDKQPLTKAEINSMVNYMRGDFEIIQPLKIKLDETEQTIVKLTEQQYKALDRMETNKRVLFKGSAGTGKTLLALEKSKRLAANGLKVLFLCYNSILGGKLQSVIKTLPFNELITVDSIHRYYQDIIDQSGWAEVFNNLRKTASGDELYKTIYPNCFVKALVEIKQEYDYLIVDEGQDLLCYEYFATLDYVLKGGLEHGKWTIFYDANKQGEMYHRFDPDLLESLKNFGAAEYVLDVNCRNTKPIATAASIMSGFEMEETLIKEGEPVKYFDYKDETDLIKKLSKFIMQLRAKGICPGDITLLFPKLKNERLMFSLEIGHVPIKITRENIDNLPSDKVSYCSVQSFKGLENKIVILFGIEELESNWISSVNYVGMTRARQILAVFFRDFLKDSMKKKLIDLM